MSAAPAYSAAELRGLHPVDRSQVDPVWWSRTALGWTPWSKQCEIMRSVLEHPRTSVRSCHGAGKSAVAARLVLWFVTCFPMSKVATTAPTMRQVERILWAELRKAWRRAPGRLSPKPPLRTRLEMEEDWFAFGFTASDQPGGAAEGLHSETGQVFIVVDEAAGVSHETYEALEGALSGRGSRLLEIGHPTDPLSQFAANQKAPGTNVIKINAWETPNFTGEADLPGLIQPEWVEDKRTRWGEQTPLWTARIEAEFPEAGGDVLFPLAWLEAAQRRSLERESGPPRLSFDVAADGDDANVVGARWGSVFRVLECWYKTDPMESCGKVVRHMFEQRSPEIVVDVVGVGSGPASRIREVTSHDAVVDCSAGKAAADSVNFANLRSEGLWQLRQRFQEGDIDIDPEDELLLAELSRLTYGTTSDGRILATPKKKIKGRKDRADACWMAFWDAPEVYDGIGVG